MKKNELEDRVCEMCGKHYNIMHATQTERERNGLPNYCFDCMKKDADQRRSERMKEPEPPQDLEYFLQTLSDEERIDFLESIGVFDDNPYIMRMKSIGSNYNDKLHKRFERMFSESHLINCYIYKANVALARNGVTHTWDYGIYDEDGNLTTVVDLEDITIFKSEDRMLTIPDGLKVVIIQGWNFKQCFEELVKTVMYDYEGYVQSMFKYFRAMPFPSPKYNPRELVRVYSQLQRINYGDKKYNDVSMNIRTGDKIIHHFHESIYHAHNKGKISPYEAWYNDEMLLNSIKNRILYQTHLNPSKILQGFNISKIAPKVSVFSAARAKLIIQKYLSNYDTVFDPFSGFSGRMLGTVSSGKKYIGQDVSEIHVRESISMITFYKDYCNFNAYVLPEDILKSKGRYPCLFTCPPYADKEQWQDVRVDLRTCDDWIDVCLHNFGCSRYVFVVDETKKYTNNIAGVISNKSHFGTNNEYIIVIDK